MDMNEEKNSRFLRVSNLNFPAHSYYDQPLPLQRSQLTSSYAHKKLPQNERMKCHVRHKHTGTASTVEMVVAFTTEDRYCSVQ
jgi:hypothetical protein